MRSRLVLTIVIVTLLTSMVFLAQSKGKGHLNPMVDLLLQHKPVFGVYAPSAFNLPGATPPAQGARGGGGGGRGGATSGPPPQEDPCGEAAAVAKVAPLTPAEVETQAAI